MLRVFPGEGHAVESPDLKQDLDGNPTIHNLFFVFFWALFETIKDAGSYLHEKGIGPLFFILGGSFLFNQLPISQGYLISSTPFL